MLKVKFLLYLFDSKCNNDKFILIIKYVYDVCKFLYEFKRNVMNNGKFWNVIVLLILCLMLDCFIICMCS